MASGKTVVGEALSRLTGKPLVDADDEIVLRAGKPIHQIFADAGEAAFRAIERDVIQDLCARPGIIIAAGGGAFVGSENQQRMLADSLVICLRASPETILRRVTQSSLAPASQGTDHPVRPMLAGDDPLARIKTLLRQRAGGYAKAHYTLETDDLTPQQVAEQVLVLGRDWDSKQENHDDRLRPQR